MAARLVALVALLIVVLCADQSSSNMVMQNAYESDSRRIFNLKPSSHYGHEEVREKLRKNYKRAVAPLEVARILAAARDIQTKIDSVTIFDLWNLVNLDAGECSTLRRRERRDLCDKLTWTNLKLYCKYCERELKNFCDEM